MGRVCEHTTRREQKDEHVWLTEMAQSYHAEPSGTFYRYDAKAIGSGSEGAQAELRQPVPADAEDAEAGHGEGDVEFGECVVVCIG